MNWEAIGAVGEVISAIAVVVSLLYVAVQIRLNTTEAKILRNQSLIDANSEVNSTIANNSELSEIVRRGMIDFAGLDEAQKFRFGALFFSFFVKYDFAYHQYLAKRLDQEFWDRMNYEISVFMSLPGAFEWWERDKKRLSGQFVSYVDSLIASHSPTESIPLYGTRSHNSDAWQ